VFAIVFGCIKATPNNSFKPTPHRGVGHVPALRLHASAAPPRVGLTQALGPMRIFIACAVLMLTAGCTDRTLPTPVLEVGSNYYVARQKLHATGWQPVAAKCSERNICFSDTPELATNLDTFSTCGLFTKDSSTFRICGKSIADGMLVESTQAGP
jgi:hypothetical protein